jgi:hypothetical protein
MKIIKIILEILRAWFLVSVAYIALFVTIKKTYIWREKRRIRKERKDRWLNQ